jgi:hypothetical protein
MNRSELEQLKNLKKKLRKEVSAITFKKLSFKDRLLSNTGIKPEMIF